MVTIRQFIDKQIENNNLGIHIKFQDLVEQPTEGSPRFHYKTESVEAVLKSIASRRLPVVTFGGSEHDNRKETYGGGSSLFNQEVHSDV